MTSATTIPAQGAGGHRAEGHAHHVFANLRPWGWITLIIGALQLLAAGGVLAGNQLARWLPVVVVVGLGAIGSCQNLAAWQVSALR